MGKRNLKWSEKTYRRLLKEGRGKGDLADYRPWLHTRDFPSKGKVSRVMGRVTGRMHCLMSQLELDFLLYLETLPDIEDIKEQYPLPLYDTQLIAARLGIDHPMVNGFPYVMTTDFYYKKGGVWHAVQIKPSSELSNERIQEKFRIEQAYWEMKNVSWCVMTEKELNRTLTNNLIWLRAGEALDTLIPEADRRTALEEIFVQLYDDLTYNFHTLIGELDAQAGLIPGTAMQLFKSLVLKGRLQLDLHRPINFLDPRQLPRPVV